MQNPNTRVEKHPSADRLDLLRPAMGPSEHTPGPWTCGRDKYDVLIFSENGELVAAAGPAKTTATCYANVRLITAAPDLLAALKETLEACAAALRVIAEIDTPTRLKDLLGDPKSREAALLEEMKIAGVVNGFGVRAKAAIAKAEGHQ